MLRTRQASLHGRRHFELALIYLTQLDEARKAEFPQILWEYGFKSTMVSFQGSSEAFSLKSGYNYEGTEFYILINSKSARQTRVFMARTGKCDGLTLVRMRTDLGIQKGFNRATK